VPSRPIPIKFLVFWIRAGWALRKLDVDLVHTIGAIVPNRVDLASIHFCHAAHRVAEPRVEAAGVPMIRRLNTTISRSLALWGERWAFQADRIRAFGAVSQGLAQEVARYYPAVPCAITPNGVDFLRFRPDIGMRLAFRTTKGTSMETTVALFVGGDWARKGLGLAIAGVASARAAGVDIELWVVGRGDQARLQSLCAKQGVGSHVHFYGVRTDTERFYQAADIFILPSAYEGLSLACLEAAASGLPLLVPAISGAKEIVGQNEGGYLVQRSVRSVTDALVRLADDPGLRSTLGSEARRRVQPYDWENSAMSVTELYRHLLERDAYGSDSRGHKC
jgi:glycosyltransferase involved in cell wall biosynthesis